MSMNRTAKPESHPVSRIADRIRHGIQSLIPRGGLRAGVFCAAMLMAVSVRAQGPVLQVQPGDTAQRLVGTAGTVGYSGDGGADTAATLATPTAVAYDGSGNLYVADAGNHVIREISVAGTITTIAGTGQEGYSGDGGPATSAMLDTPTGVAVDAGGNVYIADSHNQRIRRVTAGAITTIVGSGTPGYSGDGAAATAAALFLPSSVAVDSSGNLYIADTGNFVIREVSAGTIRTIAGNGLQGYSGDGGAATSASLDTPIGVAVDAIGNIYIADSHNQRIRQISGGKITTIAGNGTLGYSGDSGSASAAALALPRGVSVDAGGNVYVADTDNNVLRQVSAGTINTIAGTGIQGYSGDGGAALLAVLNTPRAVAPSVQGNLAFADSDNQLVRAVTLPVLSFANQSAGTISPAQSLTISDTGSASLQVQSLNLSGSFSLANGGSCGALPITVAAGSSCTVQVQFAPTAVGAFNGSVVISGAGLTPQTILLSGIGILSAPITTTTSLTASTTSATAGASVTFTATVRDQFNNPVTGGTVTFNSAAAALGSAVLNNSGQATFSTTTLPVGSDQVTASFAATATDAASTSSAVSVTISAALVPNFSLAAASNAFTTSYGQSVNTQITLTSINGFAGTVNLACSGLTSACIFNPGSVSLSANGSQTSALSIGLPPAPAMRQSTAASFLPARNRAGRLAALLAMLGLTFASIRFRKSLNPACRSLFVLALLLVGIGSMAACGGSASTKSTSASAQTILVTVVATSGTLTQSIPITVTIQ